MAITATERAEFSDTSQATTYTTASFSPSSASTVLVVTVGNVDSATDDLPTLTDSLGQSDGLWTQIEQQGHTATDIYNITTFWVKPSSTAARTITATFANAQTGCNIHVLELSGNVHLTNPVKQHTGASATTGNSGNCSLVSVPVATSVTYYAQTIRRNPPAWTDEAGWTNHMDAGHSTPANGLHVSTKTNDQIWSATGTNGTYSWVIVEFQIASNTVAINQVTETDSAQALILGRSYNFNGGTAGNTVTTSDTGSGDVFDSVQLGTTGTAVYSSAAAVSGNLGARLNGGTNDTAYFRWAVGEQPASFTRFYLQSPTAIPTVSRIIYRVRTSSSVQKACVKYNASGNIVLCDAASVAQFTSAKAFVAGERFRLEVHFVHDATVGHMEARLFWGANLHGSTASETIGNLSTNLNTTAASTGTDWIEYGWVQAVTGEVLDIDEIRWQTSDWVGPVSAGTVRAVAQVTETDAVQALVVSVVVPTGYTWGSGNLNGGGGVNCLTVDPLGTRWVAGGDNNGPKYSYDGGVTWFQGFDGIDESNSGQELQTISVQWSLKASTPNRVWRACKAGWTVSDDAGKSWTMLNTQPVFDHVGSPRPRVVGHIIADTGATYIYMGARDGQVWRWNQTTQSGMTSIANLGDNVTGLYVDPQSSSTLLAATRGGVYQIEDADTGTRTVRQYTGTNAPTRAEELVPIDEGGTVKIYVAAYNQGVRRVTRGTIGSGGNITASWTADIGPGIGSQINTIDGYRASSTTFLAIGEAAPVATSNGYSQIFYSSNGQNASPTWTCLTADDANSNFTNKMGGSTGNPWWGYGLRAGATPKEKSANRWIDNNGGVEQVLFDSVNRNKIIAGGQNGCWMFDTTAKTAFPSMNGLHCAVQTYLAIDPNDDDNIYCTNSDHIGLHSPIAGRNGVWNKNENGNPDLNGTTAFLPVAPDITNTPASWWAGYGERFYPSTLGEVYWHDNPSDGSAWNAMGWGAFSNQKRVIGIAVRNIGGKIVVLAAAQQNSAGAGNGIVKSVWNPGTPPTGGVWEYKNTTAFANYVGDSRAISMYWGSNTVAYCYDPQSGLWRTTNAGETWSLIWDDCDVGSAQERQGYFKVDPDNAGTLYCSFGNAAPTVSRGVWKLTGATSGNVRLNGVNGSITKTEIKRPDNASFSIPSDVAVGPGGYCAFIEKNLTTNSTDTAVYFSSDGGATLTDVTDNFFRRSAKKIFSVAMDTQGKIYVSMNGPGIIVGTPGTINKTITLVQVTETDTPQPISAVAPLKTISVVQTTETDTPQAVTRNPLARLLTEVTESDTVQTVNRLKAPVFARLSELDEAQGLANPGSAPIRRISLTGMFPVRTATGKLAALSGTGRLSPFTAVGRLASTRSATGVLTAKASGGSLRSYTATGALRTVATTANFTLKRAEDAVITFTLNDTDGTTPKNITGWTLAFRAATSQYGAATITKTPTITNAVAGIFTVTLASTDTSSLTQDGADTIYFYDIRRTDAGSRTELFEGTLTIQDTFTNG